MRLLKISKTPTLQLVSVEESSQYAILSHRWQDDEVIFKDFDEKGNLSEQARDKKGYEKLIKCCDRAHKDGYEYIWVDTCCIDRSSSAELSESLNSMYAWYLHSALCYAFLDDVPHGDSPAKECSPFRNSKWFTRGWTLQELIAPSILIFYSQEWKPIGTKSSLVSVIEEVTNVERDVLLFQQLKNVSVARKMSWAAKRETKKVEDRAYSLMGLFGVNMPTIYGEGTHAFVRLQQEILKSTNDHSIFAWKLQSCPSRLESGLLASSPDQFEFSSSINRNHIDIFLQRFTDSPIQSMKYDFSLTNHGIDIQLPVKLVSRYPTTYVAFLACYDDSPQAAGDLLGIYIQKSQLGEQFVRTRLSELALNESNSGASLQKMYIRDEPVPPNHPLHKPSNDGYRFPNTIFNVTHSNGITLLPHRVPNVSNPDSGARWDTTQSGNQSMLSFPPKWTYENVYGSVAFEVCHTREIFVATFGVHQGRVWSNIDGGVTNSNNAVVIDADTVATIHKSYDFEHGSKSSFRRKHLDWVPKRLSDGSEVALTMRRGKASSADMEYIISFILEDESAGL